MHSRHHSGREFPLCVKLVILHFELHFRRKICPAAPHVLTSFRAHMLHTCYCYISVRTGCHENKKKKKTERKQSAAPTWVIIQYVGPSTFQENGRNSSVFQKHFKFMFHLALPRRLSQCLTRPPVQRASFANLNKFLQIGSYRLANYCSDISARDACLIAVLVFFWFFGCFFLCSRPATAEVFRYLIKLNESP